MAIKIGDKVRFLNATGGGKVTGFKNKDVVLVEDEDGFETPVLAREVVVVPETNDFNFVADSPLKAVQDRNRRSKEIVVEQESVEEEEVEIVLPDYSWNERDETRDGEKLTVYLAFVPKDVKQLQTTAMSLYLVNDSNYFLNFTLSTGYDELTLCAQNMIEPQTKLYIRTIDKTEVNLFESLRFQAVAYKRKSYSAKPAIDMPLKINPTKFYKLHSFGENDYFDSDAMLVTIIKDDIADIAMSIDPLSLQRAMSEKERSAKQGSAKPQSKPHHRPELLEVDLHINELVDTVAGMSRADMLTLQIDTFHKVMRENIKNKGMRIVFIHGKGEGILRAEIEKQLKHKYPRCQFQDASFQQYGFGATQVTIH